MSELTVNIRYDRDDDFFNVELDADFNGDDIQSELDFDREFQELLNALAVRFTQIADTLTAEEE